MINETYKIGLDKARQIRQHMQTKINKETSYNRNKTQHKNYR